VSEPLAIDLCCGLGGWTDGLLSEGWRVRGYDIEAHEYGDERYPAELVIRNVLEMHGSELAEAELIVASPPCTEYSYMAMPWSRAKQIARALRGEDEFPEPYRGSRTIAELNAIFDACFRLQREASEAAGRHIPMIVENVKGAQPWVGRAKWSFGSYYLWGDVPALMPAIHRRDDFRKCPGESWNPARPSYTRDKAWKKPGENWSRFKQTGEKSPQWNEGSGKGVAEGRKGAGAEWFDSNLCQLSSRSPARKAASAKIAKIPLALSSHIARVYRPERIAA
jgi:hypothetical protein